MRNIFFRLEKRFVFRGIAIKTIRAIHCSPTNTIVASLFHVLNLIPSNRYSRLLSDQPAAIFNALRSSSCTNSQYHELPPTLAFPRIRINLPTMKRANLAYALVSDIWIMRRSAFYFRQFFRFPGVFPLWGIFVPFENLV